MSSTGWKLDRRDRASLLEQIYPAWPNIIADHVSLDYDVDANASLPGDVDGQVIGQADDGAGVQALVVAINGSTRRPDGGTYHITWSLDEASGRHAVESNDVIAAQGWKALLQPVSVRLVPAWLD